MINSSWSQLLRAFYKFLLHKRYRPPHLGLRPYPTLCEKCVGFLAIHRIFMSKSCETGPTVYHSYPRRLESVTICRFFTKAALSPSFLKTLSVDLAGVWSLSNWANRAVVNKINFLWKRFQNSFIFIGFLTFSSVVKNFANWWTPKEGLPNRVFKRNRIWLWIEHFLLGWVRNSCMSMTAAAWVIWLCTCVKHCTGSGWVDV